MNYVAENKHEMLRGQHNFVNFEKIPQKNANVIGHENFMQIVLIYVQIFTVQKSYAKYKITAF